MQQQGHQPRYLGRTCKQCLMGQVQFPGGALAHGILQHQSIQNPPKTNRFFFFCQRSVVEMRCRSPNLLSADGIQGSSM